MLMHVAFLINQDTDFKLDSAVTSAVSTNANATK